MRSYTLDHNCLVALQQNEASAPDVRILVSEQERGLIQVRLVAVGASEKQQGGAFAKNFSEFQNKVRQLGLGGLTLLKPKAYFDFAYFDWSMYGPFGPSDPEQKIHDVLFPGIAFDWTDYCQQNGLPPDADVLDDRWRNAKCDVLSMWCHIWYQGDVFVTSDKNFHKATKKPRLLALGAGAIMTPAEAVASLPRM